jgi:hypothetical protein
MPRQGAGQTSEHLLLYYDECAQQPSTTLG